jgi:hypothetical protein
LVGQSPCSGLLVAVFERADLELRGEILRGLVERGAGGVVVGEDAAVGAERQRRQAVAEQAAVDFGQRQQADQRAILLGEEEVGAMAEGDSITRCQPARWKKVASGWAGRRRPSGGGRRLAAGEP